MGTLVFQATLGGSVNLIGPNTASTINFTLPSADGTSGQALTTNGSGTLSFATVTTGAAGSTTQVQYNSSGAFAGSANLTFNGTTLTAANTSITTSETLSYGTANGVTYLNGSKQLVSGSALTFDGTNLGVGGSSAGAKLSVNKGASGAILRLTDGSQQSMDISSNAGVGSAGVITTDTLNSGAQAWAIASSEGMRLTSTGLGIGTSSPGASTKLNVAGRGLFTGGAADPSDSTSAGVAINYNGTTGFIGAIQTGVAVKPLFVYGNNLIFGGSPTSEFMRLDSAGNFALGISSGYRTAASYTAFAVNGTTGSLIDLYANGVRTGGIASTGVSTTVSSITATPLIFSTTDTERARIDSSGNLLVGATSQPVTGAVGRIAISQSISDYSFVSYNTNAIPYGIYQRFSTDPNGAGNEFYVGNGNGNVRFAVRSNGGIANYSANNVNLSDRREKTNFAPAKSYLDVICSIPVQTYNYIDQNLEEDAGLTLGVVAQDVQAVAPELVTESNWGTEEEPKMRLSIYQTDLQYALMKCIQEQQAIISAQATVLESLKARLDAANL